MAFAETAQQSIQEKDHERFGFSDAAPYFEERIGVRYRTLQRYLSVLKGLDRVKALHGPGQAA